jgi:hypothetical protein
VAFKDPFADQYGPRVLGDAYKPPPEIPESLVRAMKVRVRRAVEEKIEREQAPLSMVDVDLDDLYGEPEPETGDDLTPEQEQVLRDL